MVSIFAAAAALCAPRAVVALSSLESRWEAWDQRPLVSPRDWVAVDPALIPFDRTRGANRSDSAEVLGGVPEVRSFGVRRLPLQAIVGVAAEVDSKPGPPPPDPGVTGASRASFASLPPVVSEEDGVRLDSRGLAAAEPGGEIRYGEWLAQGALFLWARPGGPAAARVQQAFVARDGDRHSFLLGRAPIRWGAGVQGSLLLGRSAPPLWQARWITRRALSVPWTRRLGTWSGDAFLALLDDEKRTIPDPLLLGHRFAWQPAAWLEIAGARTVLFGGRGRTRRLTLADLGDILLGRNENLTGSRPPSDSDQRAGLEARVALPPALARRLGLDGVEAAYEYAGEDFIRPPLPAAPGHLTALAIVRRGWQARTELAETVSRNRWYDRHSVYRDSHFYRGYPLGLSTGPDVESTHFDLSTPPGPYRGRLTHTRLLLGKVTGNRERRLLWGAAGRLDLSPRLSVELEGRWAARRGSAREPLAPPLRARDATLRLTWR